MTKLLVSVRSALEARTALDAGADLIDVKEPANGSLGAPAASVVEGVVAEVASRAPVSVALGELRDWGRVDDLAILGGVGYAKVGMASCGSWPDWPERWALLLRRFPLAVRPVAVVYADGTAAGSPEPERIVAEAVRLRCAAVLVDTFDKSRGSLLDAWPLERLKAFISSVRREGMLAVVGGSLTLEILPRVAALGPDYVALRGAVCHNGRTGPLDADLVRRASWQIAAKPIAESGEPKAENSKLIAEN